MTLFNSWRKISSKKKVPHIRNNHSACVKNNSMYIFGGYDVSNGGSSDSFYKWNFENDWEEIQLVGDVPGRRYAHTCVVYKDLLICYAGFNGTYLSDCFIYNFNNSKWTKMEIKDPNSENPVARAHHTGNLFGNYMVIFGGVTNNEFYLNDVCFLNLENQNYFWKKIKTFGLEISGRGGHCSQIYKNQLISFGGYSGKICTDANQLYSLNLENFHWTILESYGDIPKPRYGHAMTIFGNKLYLFGGFDGKQHLNDFYFYSFSSGVWQSIQNLGDVPFRRAWHSLVVLNGNLTLFGGQRHFKYNNTNINDLLIFKIPIQTLNVLKILKRRAYCDLLIQCGTESIGWKRKRNLDSSKCYKKQKL